MHVIQSLDGGILLWLQESVRGGFWDPIVSAFTHLGDHGLLFIALTLAMLCWKPTRRAGILSACAMLLGLLCTNVVLKHLVARPRPWLDVAGLIPLVDEPDPNSFPSGHTCAAFAAGLSWFRALPERWMGVLAVVLAVCMGLSRLYVGVHYPSDVLAGALVGSFCAWLAWKLCQKAWKQDP